MLNFATNKTTGCKTGAMTEPAKMTDPSRGVSVPHSREVKCRVTSIAALTENIYQVLLAPKDNAPIGGLPGQYLEIVLPDGYKVPFSIANGCKDDNETLELHIACAAEGSISFTTLGILRGSREISVIGPKGNAFMTSPATRPLVLVASGTGFAQSKAIVESQLQGGAETPILLYWRGNGSSGIYMHKRIERWSQDWPNFDYISETRCGATAWDAQRCAKRVDAYHNGETDYDLFISGSTGFVSSIASAFVELGLPWSRVHSDLLKPGAGSGESGDL